MEEALVRAEGWNFYVVPVQARVPEVWLAVQERRRPLHSLTEVVVVITEWSCMLIKSNPAIHVCFKYNVVQSDYLKIVLSYSECLSWRVLSLLMYLYASSGVSHSPECCWSTWVFVQLEAVKPLQKWNTEMFDWSWCAAPLLKRDLICHIPIRRVFRLEFRVSFFWKDDTFVIF